MSRGTSSRDVPRARILRGEPKRPTFAEVARLFGPSLVQGAASEPSWTALWNRDREVLVLRESPGTVRVALSGVMFLAPLTVSREPGYAPACVEIRGIY